MFDNEKFQQIRRGTFGQQFFYFQEIHSTNAIAVEKARERVEEGSIVFADSQSEGRGRGNHKWFSPADVNLYFTAILYPDNSRLHYLPFLAGLAISRALGQLQIESDLKWPNDVLVQGKKIAGILIQTSMEENYLQFAILGIGMNVNVKNFPPDLSQNSISAFQALGRELDREELLALVLFELEQLYEKIDKYTWDELTRMFSDRSSYIQGCDVEVEQQGRIITGTTSGLDSMGGLILQTSQGKEIVYAGEISSCRKK